jgi:hypothetical protein
MHSPASRTAPARMMNAAVMSQTVTTMIGGVQSNTVPVTRTSITAPEPNLEDAIVRVSTITGATLHVVSHSTPVVVTPIDYWRPLV